MNKIEGKIYDFFPVFLNDDDESFTAVDNSWQWKLFGWWFEMYTWMRAITADIMGIENLPFAIKIADKEYKKNK